MQAGLVPVWIGTKSVDREARKVAVWGDLYGVELDHRVVQGVADSGYGADEAMMIGTLGDHRSAGPPQWPAVNPTSAPALSWPIVPSVQ